LFRISLEYSACALIPANRRGFSQLHPGDVLRDERAVHGVSMMRTLITDFRYALRTMSRAPSFAAAVIGVLALGIGANTAIFSIVNAVLLRPLPFEDSERLVRLFTRPPQAAFPGQSIFAISPGKFYDWQATATSFEAMAMYRLRRLALAGVGTARQVESGAVGPGFFEVVRARPALGRVFRPEEDAPGNHRVVILSDRFWRSELGGAPDVVGRSLTLDDHAHTIVGVMPPEASVDAWDAMDSDIWVPLALTDAQRAVRGNHNQRAVARLRPDVDLAVAQSEMNTISKRLEQEFPESDSGWGAAVVPMQEEIVGESRAMLLMLLGAVGLVLLIACANVGNLLVARALARRKEIAVRAALGAGRRRVVQQLVVEAVVLAVAAGAVGLLLAQAALTAAAALLAERVPRAQEISIDTRVLVFTAGASMLAGLLAGTLPAWRAGRSDLTDALKEGGRGEGAIGAGTRRALIVCEVALSVVLLMGAGVLIQSLLALRNGDTGFDANNVLTMNVTLVGTRYPSPAQRTTFFDAALERIRALPGVTAAATIDDPPLTGGSTQPVLVEGRPEPPPHEQVTVQVRQITPGYLRAMRIPVVRGRDVADGDVNVMLVSRDAAKLLWGAADPVADRAVLPLISRTVLYHVVGVVGDVKQLSLAEPSTPTVYRYTRDRSWSNATFVVRTSVPSDTIARSAAAAVREIDPQQPVEDVRTMTQLVDERLSSERFSALLLGGFAAAALLLASIGIYSVLSYIVRGRRREIGIRTALGARTGDVVKLVIAEGMSPALVGIAVGAVVAVASARVLQTLAFGISATDPATLAAVSALLALVALLASLVPAYRASRFDPVKVLRAD
jgi:putative ABC transport system permease protein